MNVSELKNKCNTAYSQAIELLEESGDRNAVWLKLLDAADLLVKIGNISFSEKAKCEDRARKLLDCVKRLRAGEKYEDVYLLLTGKTLILPEKPAVKQEPIPQIAEQTIEEISAIPKSYEWKEIRTNRTPKRRTENTAFDDSVSYQFNWDNLPEISFDDVAGLDDVKDAVYKKVLLPLQNPELYEGYVKKHGGGLLLYGPPGTGKTMIAAAIAREIGAKFCSIGASDLVLGGLGNSTKAIVKLFEEARSFPCAVIFFDEIESLCQVNTHAQHTREIRSELLRQIQGLDSYGKENNKILFLIAATNKPWDIDPAFVRPGRFGTRIYIGLPDEAAREYIVRKRVDKIKAQGIVTVSDDIDYQKIVGDTNGFNGADMENLLDEVQEISILRSVKSGEKILQQADFEAALQKITTSVQQSDLQKLENWKNQNG